jgi:cation diffusion facilitator CzcD-associated flavoprotein CzcO
MWEPPALIGSCGAMLLAGLAMSAVLRDLGRDHVVLERRRAGERWRSERWDSLRFQFPNWSITLPGYRYAGGDPDGVRDRGGDRLLDRRVEPV